MADSNIHPTAVIEPGAQLGSNVTIEPYVVIKKNVTVGDNVTIKAHVYLDGHTTIGEGTVIWPGASIGTKTQAIKFHGEKTFVKIGKNCDIREYVTINSSSEEGSTVRVGDNCLIMAYVHIAHHCEVGSHVIMSNGVMLAGHVQIEDYAILGGMTPVHQFVKIGCHSMVGGFSRVTHDIPPYTLGAGIPYKVAGLNLVGLKRRNFTYELRKALTQVFKLTYRSGHSLEEALRLIEEKVESSPPVQHWIDFCRQSKRGLIGFQKGISQEEDHLEEAEEEEKIDCPPLLKR